MFSCVSAAAKPKRTIDSMRMTSTTTATSTARTTTRGAAEVKSKIGSTDNIRHAPGGGNVRIVNDKAKVDAESKVGSLDYAKHTPGKNDKQSLI